MPLLTYGELKIRGCQEIGGLGESRGIPAVVYWRLTDSLVRLVPWGVVVAILLLSPNRTPKAWLIAIPMAASWGAIWAIGQTMGGSLEGKMGYPMGTLWLMCPALAVLWLQSYVFARYRWWRCIATALLLLAGMGFLGYVADNGLDFSTGSLFPITFIVHCTTAAIVVAALALSGLRWRKRRPGGWRFGLSFLLQSVAAGGILTLLFFLVLCVLGEGPGDVVGEVPQVLLFGGVLGALGAVTTAPFVAFTFVSGYYRGRFATTFPPTAAKTSPAVIEGDFA